MTHSAGLSTASWDEWGFLAPFEPPGRDHAAPRASLSSQLDESESPFSEAPEFEARESGQGEAFEAGFESETDTFPSGVVLQRATGPTGQDEEHWDPHHTGLPLLATGPETHALRVSRSFTVGELVRSGGQAASVARISPVLVDVLQRIRDRAGRSVRITSGYRSWARNQEVYRARKQRPTLSRHCSGQAADIKIGGLSGIQIAQLAIDAAGPDLGIGLGSDFIHVDVRGTWAVWSYLKGDMAKTALDTLQAYRRSHARGGALPRPAPPPPSPAPGAGAVGRLVVDHHPMLRTHVGTAPDLVMRWNAITQPGDVDVVVHFHGFSRDPSDIQLPRDKEPMSGIDFSDPAGSGASGRIRPTLGLLPRGHHLSGRKYSFPALVRPGALLEFISDALTRFSRHSGIAVSMGRLILTAHSGGGAALAIVLAHTDPDEVHVFDGLYGPGEALVRWAGRRISRELATPAAIAPALRIVYRPGDAAHPGTQPYSEAVARSLCPLLEVSGGERLAPHFRVDRTQVAHDDIPRRFGWALLADSAAEFPGVTRRRCPPRGSGESWESTAQLYEPSNESQEALDEGVGIDRLGFAGVEGSALKGYEPEGYEGGYESEAETLDGDDRETFEPERLDWEEAQGLAATTEGAEWSFSETESFGIKARVTDPDPNRQLAESEVAFEQEAWRASPEQIAFREAVLAAHIALRSKGGKRKPARDLPESALKAVPSLKVRMRAHAADAAGHLLAEAREALAEARNAGDADARRTVGLGATSGYRSPKDQLELWRGYFPKYYAATETARSEAIGGEHGPAARKIALQETAQWIGAPGFSNHNAGIAIDFKQARTRNSTIRNSSTRTELARWRKTWFYDWLVANAANYGFQPYAKEPWHWEYRPVAKFTELDEFDTSEFGEELADEGGTEAEDIEESEVGEDLDDGRSFESLGGPELGEAELDETESAMSPATEEWAPFLRPTVPVRTSSSGASRSPALISSCLPVLCSIPSVTATWQSARGARIDEIVLHDTASGRLSTWDAIKSYLAKPGDGRQVSIHYLIGRGDGQIVSMVPEERRAWHATSHNRRSIGIEMHKRAKEDRGFTDWQYRAVSQLVYDLMLRHGIPPANVVAHRWIDPKRRNDPVDFDWTRFGQMVGQLADCARAVDPSLVVADAPSVGARGRTEAQRPTKEAAAERSDLEGLEELQEYMSDFEGESGEELGLFEDEAFDSESETEEGEEYDVTETLDEDRLLGELGEEALETMEEPTVGVFDRVKTALEQKLWSGAAALMIASGIGDEKQITNTVFRARHPELEGRPMRADEKALATEWAAIRDRIVRPLLSARVSTSARAPAGPAQVRLKRVKSGYAAYGGGRLDARLRELVSSGRLSISERDIDTLQRVASVESSGLANALNTWDSGVVSIAFKQWTLRWGELQDLVSRVPAAFARHGIRLATDGSTYTFRSTRTTWQQPAIDGAPNMEDLRNEDWSRRFYLAALEPEALVAAAEKALEEIAKLEGQVRKRYGWSPHLSSPRGRALLVELHNNRPAYVRIAVPRALQRAGKDASEEDFLKILVEEIIDAYTTQENDATKGRRWTGNIMRG
jgi:LAS superfamily LD-carboxypeptidase LdcB